MSDMGDLLKTQCGGILSAMGIFRQLTSLLGLEPESLD
jgi:hypothetical protein